MKAANANEKKRHRPAGLTLLELMIVVAIVGTLAAMALPFMQASQGTRLELAAEILAADLDYVRHLAVTNNTQYTLTWSTDEDSWTLTHTGTNAVFNTLPPTGFRSPIDTATAQATRFRDLPECRDIALHSVARINGANRTAITSTSFNALGALTQPQPVEIWLASGSGMPVMYVPVRIDATLGLATVGDITTTSP